MSRASRLEDRLVGRIETVRSETRARKEEGARLIPITAIHAAEDQPRKHFDEDRLDELAQSIRKHGLLQPIIVSRTNKNEYTVVAGERRLRACQKIGMSEVMVIIKSPSLELALVENIQREDLHPVEEARAIQQLVDATGKTQTEIGEQLGKPKDVVSKTLSLLKLPETLLDEWVATEQLVHKSDMIQLSRLPTSEEQWQAWTALKDGGRLQTSSSAKPLKQGKSAPKAPRPHSVISRIKKTTSLCDDVQIETWKDQTRSNLRNEINAAISALEELRRKIDEVPEEK